MASLPPISDPSLTSNVDSSEGQNQEQPPPLPVTSRSDSERGQSLPGLKEVVGPEYHAKRPLRPHPGPAQRIPTFFIPGVSVLYLDDLPIRTYRIGGASYNMTQPPNETTNQRSRQTVDRRRVTYRLEVVQQPEKARACGSGPRSSADRRPVDPPPVVELRVFVNDMDVTMNYDSYFILYASLDVARPIAGGKMHTPPTIPVLAGETVASCAYLERPKRAAYFIFPDLSIRHEGWYRLRFALLERVKHEMDADPAYPFVPIEEDPGAFMAPVPHEGYTYLFDVVTIPFQVYSAKKFPGLELSTPLSQLVADQGCRVRIRRDIRQRKRHPKPDVPADDGHSSYQGTPHATHRTLDHSRSASRNSLGSQYDGEIQRRPSMDSLYGRPVLPSRPPSLTGVPLASPTLPSSTSMLPPPSAYTLPPVSQPSSDSFVGPPRYMPAPKPFQPTLSGNHLPSPMRSITPDIETNTLPRIRATFDPTARQWNLPDPTATKRSSGPHTYNQNTALKAGARPTTLPHISHSSPAPTGNDYIEPDTGNDHDNDEADDDPLLSETLIYSRADGSTNRKFARKYPIHR